MLQNVTPVSVLGYHCTFPAGQPLQYVSAIRAELLNADCRFPAQKLPFRFAEKIVLGAHDEPPLYYRSHLPVTSIMISFLRMNGSVQGAL